MWLMCCVQTGPGLAWTRLLCLQALHNEDVSYAADLWALGCDVFHMLSGKQGSTACCCLLAGNAWGSAEWASLSGDPPFRDRSEYLTMERVSSVDYHLADEYHPPEARDLIARLLVLRPSDRLGRLLVCRPACDMVQADAAAELPSCWQVRERALRALQPCRGTHFLQARP